LHGNGAAASNAPATVNGDKPGRCSQVFRPIAVTRTLE
jgi:hypothetical protein